MYVYAHFVWCRTFMLPLVVLSIVSPLLSLPLSTRYYYPRQVLIPHFWTPSQQVAFRDVYHRLRTEHHGQVLKGIQDTSSLVQDGRLQNRLQHLCAQVRQFVVSSFLLS